MHLYNEENMSIPSTDSLFWSRNRSKTFEHWPFQDSELSCNPENMAAAGFVSIGGEREPDLVECVFCYKQLDGWEASDDPWSEHARHQHECSLISLNKKDQIKWTVEETFTMLKCFQTQNYVRHSEKLVESIKKTFYEEKEKMLTAMKNNLNKK